MLEGVVGKCVSTHQMDNYINASIKRRIELPMLSMGDVHINTTLKSKRHGRSHQWGGVN